MLIKKRIGTEIPSSEITPRHIYMSRRTFMAGGAAVAGAGLLAACAPRTDLSGAGSAGSLASASETAAPPVVIPGQTDELGDRLTDFNDVTGYNNYYEFSTNKEAVAGKAQGFSTNPWAVEIAGKVRNPGTFDIDTLLHQFDQEERTRPSRRPTPNTCASRRSMTRTTCPAREARSSAGPMWKGCGWMRP